MVTNIEQTLKTLRIYSFNKNNLIKCINSQHDSNYISKNNTKNKDKEEEKTLQNDDFFIPNQKDSLFWCWYIFKNGLDEYQNLSRKYFIIEKSKKIKFVEKIRKTIFDKKNKIKKKEVELNLANDAKLHLKSLEAMLLCKHSNFIFMNDKIYFENVNEDNDNTCIIKYYPKKDKYGIFIKTKDELVKKYKKKLFNVENYLKPLKSISAYKAQEIRDICSKLKINVMKNATKFKTKKDLYTLILEKI